MRTGDTYLYPSIPGGLDHLYFVLFDPDESDCTLVVNATSNQPDKPDKTTIIQGGEHKSIIHSSLIYYRGAEIIPVSQIQREIENGDAVRKEKCPPDLLERIKQGLPISVYTRGGIKQYFHGRIAPKTKP